MKYTVFNVDPSRVDSANTIHSILKRNFWQRVDTACVDGRIPEQLQKAVDECPYEINAHLKVGQLGIWFTVINALEEAPIVTFEDDAKLLPHFPMKFNFLYKTIPDSADFVALFQPRDSDHLYDSSKNVGRWLTPAYQRYGGVSMYYSEKGVQNIKALLERDGITGQYDDQLFAYVKAGELNALTVIPEQAIVSIVSADSIVQNTEYYESS